jgi:hypothetical protein
MGASHANGHKSPRSIEEKKATALKAVERNAITMESLARNGKMPQ